MEMEAGSKARNGASQERERARLFQAAVEREVDGREGYDANERGAEPLEKAARTLCPQRQPKAVHHAAVDVSGRDCNACLGNLQRVDAHARGSAGKSAGNEALLRWRN
eukprot:3367449-Pleurochrysis_carterae.AAC.1